jgi:alpha-glucoside transport system permease protein
MVFYFLVLPTIRSFRLSLRDRNGEAFVGLNNYVTALTSDITAKAFQNNALWIVFGALGSVIFGLLIAALADRSRYERVAKSLIFLPMAISFVGASVIWNFIYEYRDPMVPQIGLLNAVIVALDGEPQAWTTILQPQNTFFLIIVLIWMQTGFAMVLFSAALKGIEQEIIEAARVDGASELQVFSRIQIPSIMGTIVTVTTTVVIFTLKIFDVVLVMTGGQYGTQVIATQFYREMFINRNDGLGSALAIILLVAVIPVMIYNLRRLGKDGGI